MVNALLLCAGFVWFVLSLVKKYYLRQFSLFAWTHVALLIVVTQSYLIIQNLFQGTSVVPLRSRVPAFLDFSFTFPCSWLLYDISRVSVSRSYAPVSSSSLYVCVCGGGGGATHHTFVCVWTDQADRVNSPLPPSSRVRGVQVYWRKAGLRSNSCLVHNPPLPPLL